MSTGEFEAAVQKASRSVALIRSFPDRQLKSAGGKIITPSAKITKSIRDTYQAVGPALRVSLPPPQPHLLLIFIY
jgi:hypothetical protein